jgi:hypothetical protein
MIDLFEIILAAGKRKESFQWLIPVIFAIMYGIGAIGKIKRGKDEEKELDKELTKIDKENPPLKYRPLEDKVHKAGTYGIPVRKTVARSKPIQKARPAQTVRFKKQTPGSTEKTESKTSPKVCESLVRNIRQPQTIRDAIVFSEIIGKPRSLQQWEY